MSDFRSVAQFSTFFDGRRAKAHQVRAQVNDPYLRIEGMARDFQPIQWNIGDIIRLRQDELDANPDAWHLSVIGSEARLILRDAEAQAALTRIRGRAISASPSRSRAQGFMRILLPSLAIGLALYMGIEVIARWIVGFVPTEFDAYLGETIAENIDSVIPDAEICENPEGNEALDKMARLLTEALAFPTPFKVLVVKGEMENAMAFPGGTIVFLEGLISKAEDQDLVAGVLAHEIGHVAHRHSVQSLIQGSLIWGAILLVTGDVFGFEAIVLASLVNASYSRSMEEEADSFAVELMNLRGISSEPMAAWFEKAAEKEGEIPMVGYLSTHPASEERAAFLRGASREGSRKLLSAIEWRQLKSICS